MESGTQEALGKMPAGAVPARDSRFPPLGMLAPDPLPGWFPSEQAHLKRQQKTLFS